MGKGEDTTAWMLRHRRSHIRWNNRYCTTFLLFLSIRLQMKIKVAKR